jgi:hypothetical protein
MRYLLAALLATILLTGCTSDGEDRNFFYSGWRHPEQASDERIAR